MFASSMVDIDYQTDPITRSPAYGWSSINNIDSYMSYTYEYLVQPCFQYARV